MDDKIELTELIDRKEYVKYYAWIKAIPVVTGTPERLLARCLIGELHIMEGRVNGEVVGIVIYSADTVTGNVHVSGVHCVNNILKFTQMFWARCKEHGFKTGTALSSLNEAYFMHVTKMKKDYTAYKVIL